MKYYFLLLLAFSLFSTSAFAYPEMIRQNYANCIACHESPSGGGLLNPYGRGISTELLSTWGTAAEAKPFYGAIDKPYLKKWFNAGGDLRGLLFHSKSSESTQDEFMKMQAGIETAFKYQKFKFVSFFGKQISSEVLKGEFLRFYLQYQMMDQLTIRAGRFIPNFGINIAEHIFATRRGLGFEQGNERNQIEAMWSGEKWNYSMTFSKEVSESTRVNQEKAASAQVNFTFLDSYRVGGDLWLGDLNGVTRQILGAHALLGFNKKFYYLTEFDFQNGFDNKNGLFHFSKLGYEIIKGVHVLAIEDYQKSNLNNGLTLSNSYGLGAQWYPRPHFDFEGIWSKKRIAFQSSEYFDYAYLMMHYYF